MAARPKGDDELELEPDTGYLPSSIRKNVDIPRHRREKWHKEARELMHPAKNGYNDPLSHLLLLDTLLRLRTGQMIRANGLKNLLNRTRPQLRWDSVTVGRILSELTDLNREAGHTYITDQRDRYGTYFVIEDTPAAYTWLIALRADVSVRVAEERHLADQGLEASDRSISVWASLGQALTVLG